MSGFLYELDSGWSQPSAIVQVNGCTVGAI